MECSQSLPTMMLVLLLLLLREDYNLRLRLDDAFSCSNEVHTVRSPLEALL